MRRSFALLLAVALAIAVTQPVLATNGQPGQLVPVRGTITTVQTGMDPTFTMPGADRCPAGAVWFSVFEGQGVLSHLGVWTNRNTHCTWIDSPPGDVQIGHFALGEDTITAANGDTLTLSYGGTFVIDWAQGTATVDEAWEVTGGTGRFASATGSGTLRMVQSLATGGGSGSISGLIAYDASDRSG
jgi:hypothetical protein